MTEGFEIANDRTKQQELSALLKRRGFIWPSFEIYGGVAGFYDLGPLGSALKDNIEAVWKAKFLIEEGFMQVDCPSISPEVVFKHSGHLDEFTDAMVRCLRCSSPFRADHLLDGTDTRIEELTSKDLEREIKDRGITCPQCGGELGGVEEFNLMFKTYIGPGQDRPAYLRPETAQSIFMDFSLLYRANRERIPFGVAQLGKGFRNEISPRQGLLRQREFHMAEGEFFFDPNERSFPPFSRYRDVKVRLLRASDPGNSLRTTLGEAVADGAICSEVLAHFMGATHQFAKSIGIPDTSMRFRQHERSEMAHYARDCWDLEVETSQGWVETVGIADRSAFDLSQHARGSGEEITALRRYREPVKKDVTRAKADMRALGPLFKGRAKEVSSAVEALDHDRIEGMLALGSVEVTLPDGSSVSVPSSAIAVVRSSETVAGERFVPHVVEPSFGIDRLMVAVLEHAYHEAASSPMKDGSEADEDGGPYRVMRFLPNVAPVKCGVLPLLNKEGLPELAERISSELRSEGLTTFYDPSGSIGRRYARMDEIGTPFNITVDHESLKDGTVTLRERDTGEQRRIAAADAPRTVRDLIEGKAAFSNL